MQRKRTLRSATLPAPNAPVQDMKTITIDCSGVRDEAEFWDRYLKETDTEGSAHFGRNLDARWDALHGGPGWPGDCELRFVNTSAMSRAGSEQFIESLSAWPIARAS